jgi:hypothetical protein
MWCVLLRAGAVLALAFLSSVAGAQSPVELRFADFFVQPIGPRGLVPTARLLAAQGQRVRITGFMVQREQPLAGSFLLTPRPVQMSEHADGDADDLPAHTVTVLLPPGQQDRVVGHQAGPVTLSGVLAFGAFEDAGGRVGWLRLQLAPEALAEALASTSLLHSH